jgi:(1->4)-alpha-D-glucan 1-alpha-D-glucosylmutase
MNRSGGAPSSTYRVQLNADFTFENARAIVPYLAELGVGALYTSPFLRATPGSTHGYDVTDYASLNPEIGSEADLAKLSGALRERGMGLLVDVVPNHMGIARGANAWWQDVLENGLTSPYATFFDIDWRPLKEELRGKILLPVLGDPYGVVLERGELQLAFRDGAFTVRYFETPFPVAPPTYPLILGMALDLLPSSDEIGEELDVQLPTPDFRLEFESIITAFARLPGQQETDPPLVAERRREQIVAKRRLAALVEASPEVASALAETVRVINGDPREPLSFDALDRLLDAQSYRLSSFRTAGEEINYRRFFAINELAAVRQEVREVFQAAHALLLQLVASGAVSGLRIDHPDGLWDPAGYFRDLQRAAWLALHPEQAAEGAAIDWEAIDPILGDLWPGEGDDGAAIADRLPLYVLVEKILEPGEALPYDWAVHGTVGYEFTRVTTGLFVAGENRRAFDQLYGRFTHDRRAFATVAHDAKELMLRTALASETNVLARALNRISEQNRRTRDLTLSTLRHALREVIAGFPIYRTYVVCNGRGVPDRDRRAIERAVALARRRNPGLDPSVFDFLADVLLLRDDGTLRETELAERCHFGMKFQQLTGPVMAKGVEDTAFYIANQLIALNEVGGDPAAFGASVADFHRQNGERAGRWPDAMLTSSTHDTKRSEDVRARIAVLSELPREWRVAINRWARLNRRHKTRVDGQPAPDRNDEYLFYQTLLGVWPWDAASLDAEVIERIAAFMLKAARESQVHTSWINQYADYEQALREFVWAALDASRRNPFLEDVTALLEIVAHAGAINALAQQLLKLSAPGVPDLYQGTELWDQSLVDPDNRRPVDFDLRLRLLRALRRRKPGPRLAADLLAAKDDGRLKLYLTSRTLAYRRAHPDLFARGEYVPLAAAGLAAEHVVAFARRNMGQEAIVVVPRLVVGLTGGQLVDPLGAEIWEDTGVVIPDVEQSGEYREWFTDRVFSVTAFDQHCGLMLKDIFSHIPFALLVRSRAERRKER